MDSLDGRPRGPSYGKLWPISHENDSKSKFGMPGIAPGHSLTRSSESVAQADARNAPANKWTFYTHPLAFKEEPRKDGDSREG